MLHMDFSQRVVIDTHQSEWLASPMPGVWRKLLAREEAEGGHATSIVRYDPGSSFKRHEHPGGEEILVLKGTFSDNYGDFPAGTYFRNPPGTGHAPASEDGCLLLVKLHQFQAGDDTQLSIDTKASADWKAVGNGVEVLDLHAFGQEQVRMERWPAGTKGSVHSHPGGEEVYVLSGCWQDEHGSYPTGTWLRQAPGSSHTPTAEEDTLLWVKCGHLG